MGKGMGIRLGFNTFLLTPLVCRQLVKGRTTYSHPILNCYYNTQNRGLSQWGTKKKHRNVKINLDWCKMGDYETILAPFREKVKEQVN